MPQLDYESQPPAPGPPPYGKHATGIAWVLAVALLFAYGLAGTGSDHVRIPEIKKLVLALATFVILYLLFLTTPKNNAALTVCNWVYAAFIALMAFLMFFWN